MFSSESHAENASTTPTNFIEQHLTQLTEDMILACNQRHWDLQAYPWTHMSPDFTAGPTFATIPASMKLLEFMNAFSNVYATNPEYYTRTVSVAAHMSDKAGKADVFTNFENVNFTPGVIRHSVGFWEFREAEGGKWMCVHYRSLPGPTG